MDFARNIILSGKYQNCELVEKPFTKTLSIFGHEVLLNKETVSGVTVVTEDVIQGELKALLSAKLTDNEKRLAEDKLRERYKSIVIVSITYQNGEKSVAELSEAHYSMLINAVK